MVSCRCEARNGSVYVVCAVVVSALEGKDCREAMKTVADNSSIPHDRLSHVVAGMYRVLTEATRIPTSSLKQEVGGCFNVLGHIYSGMPKFGHP